MSSIQASRAPALSAPHPLRRVTDWPAAGPASGARPRPHPARRTSDRLALAATARHVRVRRPCSAPRRRRGRAVASRTTACRRHDDSEGDPAPADPPHPVPGTHRAVALPAARSHFPPRDGAFVTGALRTVGCVIGAYAPGVRALLRVCVVPLALGAAQGHVTTIHVGWSRDSGRMRTPCPVATTPGEAMPEATGPPSGCAPVPRDARAAVVPGIAPRSFPGRCSPRRPGNAVAYAPVYAVHAVPRSRAGRSSARRP